MSIVTAMRRTSAPPPRSPARQALAEAIQAAADAVAAVTALEQARSIHGAAFRAEEAAREALAAAREGVGTAQSAAVARLIANEDDAGQAASAALRDARAAVTAAEDDLAAAQAAKLALQERAAPCRRDVEVTQARVLIAVEAVVREHYAPRLDAMIAELDAAHRIIFDKGEVLRKLSLGIVPSYGPAAPPRMGELVARHSSGPARWMVGASPSLQALERAMVALATDADAEIP